MGAFGSALGPAQVVQRGRLRILGPDHPDTAEALVLVANCMNNDKSRLEEARSLFQTAIEIYRPRLARNDPRLMGAMGGLAFTLANQGRYAESLAINEELLQIYRDNEDSGEADIARTLASKAEVLAWSGRREEGARTYEEALEILSRVPEPGILLGLPDHGWPDRPAERAGRVARAFGHLAESERIIRDDVLPICDPRVSRAEAWLDRDPREPDARRNLIAFLAQRDAASGRESPGRWLADVDRVFSLDRDLLAPADAAIGAGADADRSRDPARRVAPFPVGARRGRDHLVPDRPDVCPARPRPAATTRRDRGNMPIEPSRTCGQSVDRGFRRKGMIAGPSGFTSLKSRADFRAILDSLPRRAAGAIEGEDLKLVAKSGSFAVARQALPDKRHVGRWSGDAILLGGPSQPGEWVDLAVPLPAEGTYRATAHLVIAPGHGVVRLSLDGRPLGGPFDGFGIGPEPRSTAMLDSTPPAVVVDLGTVALRGTSATLRIEVIGKDERAWGCDWASTASCSGDCPTDHRPERVKHPWAVPSDCVAHTPG